MFTRTCHWSLPWATSIQCTSSHPISLISILMLSSHLRPCLRSDHFPSGFPTKILYEFLISPMRATFPAHPILLDLISHNNARWRVQDPHYALRSRKMKWKFPQYYILSLCLYRMVTLPREHPFQLWVYFCAGKFVIQRISAYQRNGPYDLKICSPRRQMSQDCLHSELPHRLLS